MTTVPYYDVSIKNISKLVLDDAHVSYDNFYSIGGVLPPGIEKIHGNPNYPIPDKATVEWRTKDGIFHKKEIDLTRISKDFSGEIRFEIDDSNNVAIRAVPRKK